MDPQLARWRADTPAAAAGLVHLNNAGASLMPRPVLDAIQEHLTLESRCGGYEAQDVVADAVAATYDDVARLIGAAARNIAVVENATAAFAQALSAFDFRPGDTILTTRNDYISNQLMYLSLARRLGAEIVRAEDAADGGVDPASVRRLLDAHPVKLVAVTWVPTNSGLVQPVQAVGEICRDAGVPYLVDACQAVGQMPVDVAQIHCDFLAATARKFLRGPRGLGFLYVSDGVLQAGRAPLYLDMRGARWTEADEYRLAEDATRFENWESSCALVLGLGAAARYALGIGLDEIQRRAWELAAYARERLATLPGIRVLDRGPRLSAIVTAEVEGMDAGDVVRELHDWRINASATFREWAVIDMDAKDAKSAVRLSPHYFNTRQEIDTAVLALKGIARGE